MPLRSWDVCEHLRLQTLCWVERLMKHDLEIYLQNRWVRVFLMLHDSTVDVRLKALNVVHQWIRAMPAAACPKCSSTSSRG